MATLIIENIKLEDDDTATGGVANPDETLADFLYGAEPCSYSLSDINQELKACGIKPITLEQINIVAVDAEDYN